jgi:replicative DNA helicase
MDPTVLMNRFLALESGVSFRANDGAKQLTSREQDLIVAATERVARWPLEIRDDLQTIAQVRAAAMETKPRLVVIDHVGIFHADGVRKGATSTEQASFISHQVRDLAFELNVAVLALCQINRAGSDEPTLANLKDSGSLEEDSRVVIILHRTEEQPGGVNTLDLNLAKNTNGANRMLKVRFNAPKFHFDQINED